MTEEQREMERTIKQFEQTSESQQLGPDIRLDTSALEPDAPSFSSEPPKLVVDALRDHHQPLHQCIDDPTPVRRLELVVAISDHHIDDVSIEDDDDRDDGHECITDLVEDLDIPGGESHEHIRIPLEFR